MSVVKDDDDNEQVTEQQQQQQQEETIDQLHYFGDMSPQRSAELTIGDLFAIFANTKSS
jgi:hypothetical protein